MLPCVLQLCNLLSMLVVQLHCQKEQLLLGRLLRSTFEQLFISEQQNDHMPQNRLKTVVVRGMLPYLVLTDYLKPLIVANKETETIHPQHCYKKASQLVVYTILHHNCNLLLSNQFHSALYYHVFIIFLHFHFVLMHATLLL